MSSTAADDRGPELRTERLRLRRWTQQDRVPFAQMNGDPAVMEYFVSTATAEESSAMLDWIERSFDEHGYGLWAVEVLDEARLAGFVGLNAVTESSYPGCAFVPAVEVGWRLARPFWGRGIASEAALASLHFGFTQLQLEEIIAFTAVPNERSQRVMTRIGMTRDGAGDFMHPRVPRGHHLERHVLYRVSRSDWLRGAGSPAAAPGRPRES